LSETLYNSILNYFSQQNWEQVERCCESLLDNEPGHVGALQVRGISAFQNNKPVEAIKYLKLAVQYSDNHPSVLCNLASIQQQIHREDAAIENYQKALIKNPQLLAAHNNLGMIYLEKGADHLAEKSFQSALEIDADFTDSLNNLGRFYISKKAWGLAEPILEKIIRINPDDIDAIANLGLVKQMLENYVEAIALHQKVLIIQPAHRPALSNLAIAYSTSKAYYKALEVFEKIDKLFPSELNDYQMAQTLLAAGFLKQAQQKFNRLYQQSSKDARYFIPLSALLREHKEIDKAWDILKKGLDVQPWYTEDAEQMSQGHILSLSGLGHCRFDLNTTNTIYLNGAHFNTQWLIDAKKYQRTRFYIFDKNIEHLQQLPEHQLLVNTISDPDLEKSSLLSLSVFLEKHPELQVINHPDQVLKTTREQNYQRLKDVEGLIFPRTYRYLISEDDCENMLARVKQDGFEYPYLIRQTGTQTGTSFSKVVSDQQALEYFISAQGKELYVIQFIETEFSDHIYRRFRFYFIDGQMYPENCHIGDDWNIHSVSRSALMEKDSSLQRLELLFLNDPIQTLGEHNYHCLQQLADIIGLDFFGVDFSLNEKGEIVIFEVNCSVDHTHSFLHQYKYLEPAFYAINDAFDKMLQSRLTQQKLSSEIGDTLKI